MFVSCTAATVYVLQLKTTVRLLLICWITFQCYNFSSHFCVCYYLQQMNCHWSIAVTVAVAVATDDATVGVAVDAAVAVADVACCCCCCCCCLLSGLALMHVDQRLLLLMMMSLFMMILVVQLLLVVMLICVVSLLLLLLPVVAKQTLLYCLSLSITEAVSAIAGCCRSLFWQRPIAHHGTMRFKAFV